MVLTSIRKTTARLKRAPAKIRYEARTRLIRLAWDLPSISLCDLIGESSIGLAPIILEDAGVPPYAGCDTHDDLRPVLSIARSLLPQTIVELGTSHGNLTANLCRQCPGAKIYTVNALPEEQTGMAVTHSLAEQQIGRVYRSQGFSDRVTQILANTRDLDLYTALKGSLVDLAVIDACHDTDYVINDFEKLRPFMRPAGVILFHDTHPSMAGHLAGSYLACMLLRRNGNDIRHLVNTWWAALKIQRNSI